MRCRRTMMVAAVFGLMFTLADGQSAKADVAGKKFAFIPFLEAVSASFCADGTTVRTKGIGSESETTYLESTPLFGLSLVAIGAAEDTVTGVNLFDLVILFVDFGGDGPFLLIAAGPSDC